MKMNSDEASRRSVRPGVVIVIASRWSSPWASVTCACVWTSIVGMSSICGSGSSTWRSRATARGTGRDPRGEAREEDGGLAAEFAPPTMTTSSSAHASASERAAP
jgi:hypothetical protein